LQITGDQSKTLYSERYKQTYHSIHGAVNESRHVFLRGAKVAARLENREPTRVLEIGFGLGLNFVLTADCAQQHDAQLEYVGVEHNPITAEQFAALEYAQWLDNVEPVEAVKTLLQQCHQNDPFDQQNDGKLRANPGPRSQRNPEFEQSHTIALKNNGYLNLLVGDVTSLPLRKHLNNLPRFDAIFLDAFSPDANPECWTSSFLSTLALLMKPTGVLATYCVKGAVQRNLAAAGFSVKKSPGPTGKREILSATLIPAQKHPIT
jgi:tRNA U34 5-methylaminomethyl-2-thiouridine-forming methyltransferase MnmC